MWKDTQGREYHASGMIGLEFLRLTHMERCVDPADNHVSVAVRVLHVPLDDALASVDGTVPLSASFVF